LSACGLLADHQLDSDLSYGARIVAGRAAHLLDDPTEAAEHFRAAQQVAPDLEAGREAMWSELMCDVSLERSRARERFEELAASVRPGDAVEALRKATLEISLYLRIGRRVDLHAADAAAELIEEVSDLFARTGFRMVYSHALVLAAEYEKALAVVGQQTYDADTYYLPFVVPYIRLVEANALLGQGFLPEAAAASRLVNSGTIRTPDPFLEQSRY
jgi:hypothetical protein